MSKNTSKFSGYQLVINEVDCYESNSSSLKIFSKKAVQHQILLEDKKQKFHAIGILNAPSDNERGQLIIKNFHVPAQVLKLFKKAQKYKNEKRSEYCDTQGKYEEAKIYNKAFNDKIRKIAKEIYDIENMGIDFDSFYKHLIY